jgi:hypothetical protein
MPHASRFEGAYRGLWQRTRSILGYLYMYYMEDSDYFRISGEDMVEMYMYYMEDCGLAMIHSSWPMPCDII